MTAAKHPPPDETVQFLSLLFAPGDLVNVRFIETWIEDRDGKLATRRRNVWKEERVRELEGLFHPSIWTGMLDISHREKANIFFGVCPRFGGGCRFNLAWQIRTVRVLWADLDRCSVAEAKERCARAGLPEPSIIVVSGHGVHLYWLLTAAYLIDDASDPLRIEREFVEVGGKKRMRPYFVVDGEKVYRMPGLSPKGQLVKDAVAGIAAALGADHTIDLSRLLRIPGTLNRKDQRNGKEPVPCTVAACEPERRYPFEMFLPFADQAKEAPHAKTRRPRSPSANGNGQDGPLADGS